MTPETADAVVAVLNADDAGGTRGWAPSLIERLGGPAGVPRVRQQINQQIGSPVSVRTDGDEQRLHGPLGQVAVWAEIDAQGRLSGLLIAPERAIAGMRRTRIARTSLGAVALLITLSALLVVSAWASPSRAETTSSVLELVLFGVLLERLVCCWFLPLTGRLLIRGLGLAGIAALVRTPLLPSGSWNGAALSAAALATVVAGIAWASWSPTGPAISRPLSFPFAQGRWVILQGGRGVLNHHRRVAEQAGALDLVRLGSRGATVDALYRHALGAFPAYGSTVLAPCDGVVLATRDGLPDQGLERPRLAPAAGNHVRIDTGSEQILLAHLLPGSLLVDVGQRVTRGQPIGQVGNSGNTSEPHLHLHAERDGVGLQLQFERVRGPLTRSRVINAR